MYNYREVMKSDIIEHIYWNYSEQEIKSNLEDREAWEEQLNDILWIEDGVTGNASGSYFFNAYRAEEAIAHNWDILSDALSEFGCEGVNPIEKGAEWCDVTIRCYLLSECVAAALDVVAEIAEEE